MDIEKLKRCLKCCADDNSKACNKCELEYGEEECQNLCGYAATALSTLQAENEKLRDEVERQRRSADNRQHLYENAERAYMKVLAELEQAKREQSRIPEGSALVKLELLEELDNFRDLGPIDRLRELKKADDEGRCVVLPFKPPRWVYVCSTRFPKPAQAHYASAINVLQDMDKGCVFGDTQEELPLDIMPEDVDKAPTIDAVPVVRCQECKHKNTTACPAYDAPFMRTSLRIKFCSEGKRKEGDHVRNN